MSTVRVFWKILFKEFMFKQFDQLNNDLSRIRGNNNYRWSQLDLLCLGLIINFVISQIRYFQYRKLEGR